MNNPIDTTTVWYQQSCANEMNRFYDTYHKNPEITRHLAYFTTLLARTGLKNCPIIDLGCGTAQLSDFCTGFVYTGADLPHILSATAMRNYPEYFYHACDLIKDELAWIRPFPIAVVNAVIDIMQYPLEILEKVLTHCNEYLIIHRQEITEAGETRIIKNGAYGGQTYHSIINRKDFTDLVDRMHFDVVQEVPLEFKNWENGGTSFLLRRRKSFALYHLDYGLYEKYFRGKENGFFIEAGANDGLTQSNTYYLEFYKNWKGILIEPLPEQHSQCVMNRSQQTKCIHGALTDNDNLMRIDMIYTPSCNGLMSVIDDENAAQFMNRVLEPGISMIVPATTLNRALDNYLIQSAAGVPLHIDLLVLDVEGYELKALRGLDLQSPTWTIEYILVEELQQTDEIQNYLAQFGYERIDKLSHHDYLYKKG